MIGFVQLSIALGVLMFAENIKLLLQEGELLRYDRSFSVIELVWLVVSLWWLFQGGLDLYAKAMIGVLVSYHLFGWMVALRAMQLSDEAESDVLLIPFWYFKINMAICMVYVGAGYAAISAASA